MSVAQQSPKYYFCTNNYLTDWWLLIGQSFTKQVVSTAISLQKGPELGDIAQGLFLLFLFVKVLRFSFFQFF